MYPAVKERLFGTKFVYLVPLAGIVRQLSQPTQNLCGHVFLMYQIS